MGYSNPDSWDGLVRSYFSGPKMTAEATPCVNESHLSTTLDGLGLEQCPAQLEIKICCDRIPLHC